MAGQLDDFFLVDSKIHTQPECVFYPPAHLPLYLFKLIPKRSETTLVSLAFASGLINHALELDEQKLIVPAMGQSISTFNFKPHSKLDVIFSHTSGQVEIDGLFLAKRNGQDHLFIMEAKSDKVSSLAKQPRV